MKTLTLAASLTAAVLSATTVQAADTAKYEVRIDATWTAATHPDDYPVNAHFSGLVGATHNDAYRIFADGVTATPGLEALAERGAHAPLTDEIAAAKKSGAAGALFESNPLFSFPGTLKASFTADTSHAYASVAAMIAPSPDWFTGVSNVALMQDGKWIDTATFTLFAWDAGTDSGTMHAAKDDDTLPRQSVRISAAAQFKTEKGLRPVGTVTFTRMRESASN